MWSFTDRRNAATQTEEFNLADALANVVSTRHIYHTTGAKATDLNTSDITRHIYEPSGTGRVESSETWNAAESVRKDGANNTVFDASGNKTLYTDLRPIPYSGLMNDTGQLREWTWLYYGADEKLRVLDRTSCVTGSTTGGAYQCWPPPYDSRPTFEEYRYDALGRRVMTITDQTWSCKSYCVTAETRTVWDGDQILAEVRSPKGSQQDAGPMEEGATMHPRQMGRVLYTHGLGLDKPLLLARIDYDSLYPGTTAIIPHTNWLGNYDSGTFVAYGNGTGPACVKRPRVQEDATKYPFEDPDVTSGMGTDSITICYDVAWPATYMWNSKVRIDRGKFGPPSWMGSLVEGGKDASGQMYMRNRYYDPGTGRFTQEDPIGLAGGINLYGFAGGDAVNFSDPYGLSPACWPFCSAWVRFKEMLGLGSVPTTGAAPPLTVSINFGAGPLNWTKKFSGYRTPDFQIAPDQVASTSPAAGFGVAVSREFSTPAPDDLEFSMDAGLNKYTGVTVNFAQGSNQYVKMTSVDFKLGVSTPSLLPVAGNVKIKGRLTNTFSCAKSGQGCN